LKEYASKLGSDCPFFIENKTAFVTGRGEIIQTIPFELKGLHIIIIKPDLHISTQEAYSNITPAMPLHSLQKSLNMPIEKWKNMVTNDFEKALQKQYPQLDKIKKDLYDAGAIYVSMSGSGSSIYGLSKNILAIPQSLKSHFCWQGLL
jgi:4-diphosphocytidyl-2-C-methyl-D-erythritol kinase